MLVPLATAHANPASISYALAKGDLGHHLLELSVLRAQVLDLIVGGLADGIPREGRRYKPRFRDHAR
jgi:hypothetical protein